MFFEKRYEVCAALAKQLGWAAPSCSLKEQLTSRVGKRKIFNKETTKENYLAKDTRRKAKTIVVTLEDNHSLRHLKIIVVKRQMIKIASLRMKCAPSRPTAALHIVQCLLLQIVTHP